MRLSQRLEGRRLLDADLSERLLRSWKLRQLQVRTRSVSACISSAITCALAQQQSQVTRDRLVTQVLLLARIHRVRLWHPRMPIGLLFPRHVLQRHLLLCPGMAWSRLLNAHLRQRVLVSWSVLGRHLLVRFRLLRR